MKRIPVLHLTEICGLVLLSVILKSCCEPDPDYSLSTDYDPRVQLKVSSISPGSVVLEGKVQQKPYYTIKECGFDWSTTALYTSGYNSIDNVVWSDSSGYIVFKDTLTGLSPKTTYYFNARVYYTHPGSFSGGSIGSGSRSFETPALFPVVSTAAIVEYTNNYAIVGGAIIDAGLTPVIERGLYWGLSPSTETTGTKITLDNSSEVLSKKLTGLSPNTNYYVKAFATNKNGTGYGTEKKFNTGNDTTFPKVADIDGNVYHIVTIGSQVWMAENLRTTRYNDGTLIPKITANQTWYMSNSGAYCWYNNDSSAYEIPYGKLYNWYAVNSGKLCPTGWHVPSDSEWKTLGDYLGGDLVAGGKLKEAGKMHWSAPNTGASNESGFTALPGGFRMENGFGFKGEMTYWWSSTEYTSTTAWTRCVYYMSGSLSKDKTGPLKSGGISVRCVKN
jgi:uncharacterized protein (TIGR02145 family)